MAEANGIFAAVPLVFLQAGYRKQVIATYAALMSFQGNAQSCFANLRAVSKRAGASYSATSKAIVFLAKTNWLAIHRHGRKPSQYSLHKQNGLWAVLPIALLHSKLSRRDILVYAALAIYQAGNESCHPKRQALAERAGIKDIGTVSKSISRLKKANWLECAQRGRKANQYQCKTASQWPNGQDKTASQWPKQQNKTASQWPKQQDKTASQWPNGQAHSGQTDNSSRYKTSIKTSSSTESRSAYRTLGVHSGQIDKTKSVHSGHFSKTKQISNSAPAPSLMGQVSAYEQRRVNNMQTKQNKEKISKELEQYFRQRGLPRETSVIRKMLLQSVLHALYSDMYQKVTSAIICEIDGVLYLNDTLAPNIKEKIESLLGRYVRFRRASHFPSDNGNALEYLQKAVMPTLSRASQSEIKQAFIKHEDGCLLFTQASLSPHLVSFLKNKLGCTAVFRQAS